MTAPLPLHLGAFHTYEMVLFVLLIAGPFLGLAVTVVLVRRRDAREEAAELAAELAERGGQAEQAEREPTSAGR